MDSPSFERAKIKFLALIKFLDNGCWRYPSRSDKHYGRIMVEGTRMGSHRFSWIMFNGPIPIGRQVLHKCDFPPCANPEHLFLGDQALNMKDMAQKGRGVKVAFEDNPNCKHGWNTVRMIRNISKEEGLNSFQIEFLTSVPASTVRCIVNGRAWTI